MGTMHASSYYKGDKWSDYNASMQSLHEGEDETWWDASLDCGGIE